jgi:hypothetical protein
MLIGVVHSLAGSAFVAILVIRTIRDPTWTIIYPLVFGAGRIAGMIIITTAIAMPPCIIRYTSAEETRILPSGHRTRGRAARVVSGVPNLRH